MVIDLGIIINAVCVMLTAIIGGYFTYNQRTKDKMTDLKIERFKKKRATDSVKLCTSSLYKLHVVSIGVLTSVIFCIVIPFGISN